MRTPPTRKMPCEKCGAAATASVTPADWDDAPKSFTLTRECPVCGKSYMPLTPEQMHESTGLPLTGWSS
jgi:hypothetical protein